jgi:hypothetical protein
MERPTLSEPTIKLSKNTPGSKSAQFHSILHHKAGTGRQALIQRIIYIIGFSYVQLLLAQRILGTIEMASVS